MTLFTNDIFARFAKNEKICLLSTIKTIFSLAIVIKQINRILTWEILMANRHTFPANLIITQLAP
jgi:hypothetical protein